MTIKENMEEYIESFDEANLPLGKFMFKIGVQISFRIFCSMVFTLVIGSLLWPCVAEEDGSPIPITSAWAGAGIGVFCLSLSYSICKAAEDTGWFRERSANMPAWQFDDHSKILSSVISGWVLVGLYLAGLVLSLYAIQGI